MADFGNEPYGRSRNSKCFVTRAHSYTPLPQGPLAPGCITRYTTVGGTVWEFRAVVSHPGMQNKYKGGKWDLLQAARVGRLVVGL